MINDPVPPTPDVSDVTERARALKLFVVLSRAQTAVERLVGAHYERHGLTEAEFGVLEVLLHRGPLRLGEIQRKILRSSGGVTFVIDRLERRGLVRREQCPDDRRAMYAVLTDEGHALIARIFPEHADAIEMAVSGLDAEEKERALDLLRRLGHHAAALGAKTNGDRSAMEE